MPIVKLKAICVAKHNLEFLYSQKYDDHSSMTSNPDEENMTK